MNSPLVSVICTAYNHEKYIRKAIESVLAQKTEFSYEFLIHDDASTDHTAEIIREYAEKYPDIIVPIYEKENMYSQNRLNDCIYPYVRGVYIAYCEGDDYWTDNNKIQIQAEYLNTHPGCTACCHAFYTINEEDTRILDKGRAMQGDGALPVEFFIEWRTKDVPQISTSMIRKKYRTDVPELFKWIGTIADVPIYIWCALNGEIHYMDRVMSVWRKGRTASWTARIKNPALGINQCTARLDFNAKLEEYTNHRYRKSIEISNMLCRFYICWYRRDYREAYKTGGYRYATLVMRLGVYFGLVCPGVMRLYYKMRGR